MRSYPHPLVLVCWGGGHTHTYTLTPAGKDSSVPGVGGYRCHGGLKKARWWRRGCAEASGAARAGALREARPARLLAWLSEAAERVMGGTSGAVYSLLLARAARSLAQEPSAMDADAWARAWRASLYGLAHYSTARPGDRTLLDALEPACRALEAAPKRDWEDVKGALLSAADAAARGCDATKDMEPRVGRASYVDRQRVQDVDAGAFGAAVWIRAVVEELCKD
ncbi:Uncharacterized protein GBIM_12872 [Gryllus bimaculatus]|nr:Uncharacterized protein GBIM_12872 [Gryllus bimaculatus]